MDTTLHPVATEIMDRLSASGFLVQRDDLGGSADVLVVFVDGGEYTIDNGACDQPGKGRKLGLYFHLYANDDDYDLYEGESVDDLIDTLCKHNPVVMA